MPSVVTEQSSEVAAAFAELLQRQLRGSVLGDDYFRADRSGLWTVIADGGWLDLAVPAADGGAGLTLTDLTAVAEAWGRHLIPLPLTPTLVLRGIPQLRAAAGTADMLTAAVPGRGVQLVPLPGLGEVRYAAWPEPETAREPEAGPEPGARPQKQEGPELANLPPGLAADEFAPSLRLGQAQGLSGIADADVRAQLAVLWAAEAAGAAAAAFQLAFDYAGQRVAFGRRIAEFQAVKHRVADMYEQLELARTAALWAANTVPREYPRGVRLAVELAREVVEGAIQVMGGMGFTWEAGVHFYLRHILIIGRLTRAAGHPAEPVMRRVA